MAKTVLIIHGASRFARDNIREKWIAPLQAQFGSRIQIGVPEMPDPEGPELGAWLQALSDAVNQTRGQVQLIGHSFGGTVVLKFMAGPRRRGSAAQIAATPFWCGEDPDWQVPAFALSPEERVTLAHMQLLFSHGTADEIVPFSHLTEFKRCFPEATVRSYEGMNHIDPSDSFLRDLAVDCAGLFSEGS